MIIKKCINSKNELETEFDKDRIESSNKFAVWKYKVIIIFVCWDD